ncbi:hypothetical protein ACIBFB_07150 [Nocardiopsis sp. NPDC050513]|uniref:hypothetical protein n=1 Tax=Nocardiopsis sp. NPDC050513 TaxID=3364338 RepID=UPI0037A923F1
MAHPDPRPGLPTRMLQGLSRAAIGAVDVPLRSLGLLVRAPGLALRRREVRKRIEEIRSARADASFALDQFDRFAESEGRAGRATPDSRELGAQRAGDAYGDYTRALDLRGAQLRFAADPSRSLVTGADLRGSLERDQREAETARRDFERELRAARRIAAPPASESTPGTRTTTAEDVSRPALHDQPRRGSRARDAGGNAASENQKTSKRRGRARSTVRAAEVRPRRNDSAHRGRARS